jgi:hypothetical protein
MGPESEPFRIPIPNRERNKARTLTGFTGWGLDSILFHPVHPVQHSAGFCPFSSRFRIGIKSFHVGFLSEYDAHDISNGTPPGILSLTSPN